MQGSVCARRRHAQQRGPTLASFLCAAPMVFALAARSPRTHVTLRSAGTSRITVAGRPLLNVRCARTIATPGRFRQTVFDASFAAIGAPVHRGYSARRFPVWMTAGSQAKRAASSGAHVTDDVWGSRVGPARRLVVLLQGWEPGLNWASTHGCNNKSQARGGPREQPSGTSRSASTELRGDCVCGLGSGSGNFAH